MNSSNAHTLENEAFVQGLNYVDDPPMNHLRRLGGLQPSDIHISSLASDL